MKDEKEWNNVLIKKRKKTEFVEKRFEESCRKMVYIIGRKKVEKRC